MRMTPPRRRTVIAVAVALTLTLLPVGPASAATTRYVDRQNPSCSNSGPGTAAIPYCTLQRAANVVQVGDTVIVASGTYTESVEMKRSGTSSAPITFETAPGANVTVRGSSHGFEFPEVDWIILRGFRIMDTTDHAVYMSGSTNLRVEGNDVSGAGEPIDGDEANGFYVSDTVDTVIADNAVHHNTDSGIYLKGDTTRVEVVGNEVYANAAVFERVSPGIDIRAAGNSVIGNTSYDNEDTGIQIYPGGANTLIANNVTVDNGDHGIDVLDASGQRITGNTVIGSLTAGINVEGDSSGATIANNISVNNGVNSPRTVGNIRVDDSSIPGTTMDYNLVFQNTAAPMYFWDDTIYPSLSALRAASGQEAHGIQANPMFRNESGDDYHLSASSSAIDSGNSGVSGQQATDLDGTPRHDYPPVTNTGAGPRNYDDRGAYEFRPSGAPVAVDDDATTGEDTAITIDVLANDFDPEGDTLALTIASEPAHGSVSITPSKMITYTPAANYYGNDVFAYTATDPSGGAATANVQITITPVNDPPLAQNDIATTVTNQAVNIDVLANDIDVDGDDLSVIGVTNPSHGSASINPSGTVRYHPATAYAGGDSFNYTVSDGNGGTAIGRVDVTVEDAGSVPSAGDDEATTAEDTTVTIDVLANDSDPGGGQLNVDSVTQPANGTAAIGTSDEITYEPAANFHGQDSFSYVASNSLGATTSAQVTVTVTPINDDPVATDDSASTEVGTAVSIAVLANDTDVDGDVLSVTGIGNPAHGSAAVAGGSIVYTPGPGYVGSDSFGYSISDGAGGVASAQVSITVNPAEELVGNTGFESSTAGWAGAPSGVSVTRVAGGHSGAWAGRVSNGLAGNVSNCTLNDSPNWVAQTKAGTYSVSLWVRADSPGASFKLRIREYAGSTSVGANTVTRTLTTTWQHVSLDYTVGAPGSTLDFSAYSTQAPPGTCFFADDVSMTLSAPNNAPIAHNDIGTTITNQAVNIDVLANDTDANRDTLTVTGVTNPAHGSASINPSGTVRYQPATGYEGDDFFNYTVADGNGETAIGRVDITVEDAGSVPNAVDDDATTAEDTAVTIDVLENDSDPGGGALSIESVTQPAHGTVTITASDEINYAPTANYHGGDSFTYVVTNPGGASASAEVTITVTAVNDDPVASDDSASTEVDTAVSIAVLANDTDVDGDVLSVAGATSPAHGSTAVAGGSIVYTPNSGYVGPDSFGYSISDGAGGVASAQVSITVTAAQELVGNPGFESSTTGWAGAPSGISVTRVAGGHSGAWAGRVTNGLAGNVSNCTLNDSPNWVAQSQAGTYSVSLWVRADSPGATFKLRIREYAGSTSVGANTVTRTLTTTWQRVNLDYTVGAPGSTLDFSAYSMQAPPGTCFYADDVSITRS